ncbi:MAG: cupin domain-containing protein [Promethearchaeota archaeon]
MNDKKTIEMIPGIFRTTLVYNKDAMLCHFLLKKDAIIELHSHDAAQLGFVIRGKAEFWQGDKSNKTIVNPGDSYIIHGGIIHGARMIEETEIIECFAPSRPEYED